MFRPDTLRYQKEKRKMPEHIGYRKKQTCKIIKTTHVVTSYTRGTRVRDLIKYLSNMPEDAILQEAYVFNDDAYFRMNFLEERDEDATDSS